jgi:hypothetical protein
MALQMDTNRSSTPTAEELERIFRPAAERAHIRIAELDALAQEAGCEAQASMHDPLVSLVSGVFKALTAPRRGQA